MNPVKILIFLFFITSHFVSAVNEPIIVEAENALAGSDFNKITEGNVIYLTPKVNNATTSPGTASKVLTFSVNFPETGVYEFYARIRVGSGSYSDDSFFFGKTFGQTSVTSPDSWYMINGVAPVGYNKPDEVVSYIGSVGTQTWKWLNISRFFNSTSPVLFSVSEPNTTVVFQWGSREDGLDLDKIAFCKSEMQYTVSNLDEGKPGKDPSILYNFVETYVNPVFPGDHPDPSLLKVGDDFYASGSCFHFTPYSPIYHSKDLVHWDVLTRVVPSNWSGLMGSQPAGGIWGGTLSYFYGYYWYYFSNTAGGGQYFSKSNSPSGPWSAPVKVRTTADTGPIGYDNSIFVDDDGTPYMLIKPGQFVNRIQKIGTDGHLTAKVINMDWVNTAKKYSWAEGPVMCKRNGWYYYFIAGNVAGGQYVIRSRSLTSDSLSWEAMGNFFETVSDPNVTFRNPNHITQPFMLQDSTWWTISHSYENLNGDSWDGKGRQGLLHQIIWDEKGKPTGKAPTTQPQTKPALQKGSETWKLPFSDEFSTETLNLNWHFLNPVTATKYSLKSKPGWITLNPGADSCHILQKDAGRYYSMVSRVAVNTVKNGQAAGLYITNGNMSKSLKLVLTYNNGKKITFSFLNLKYETANNSGDTVWLKLERKEHLISAYHSNDGFAWTQIGSALNVQDLDKTQDNYNSWVGNSQGLFSKGITAHFDNFFYRDGFSKLLLAGRDNYYGVETISKNVGKVLTNTTNMGGWFMLGGVQIGDINRRANKIEITASSTQSGILEVWLNDIERNGTKIAEINITTTTSADIWKTFSVDISEISGRYDIYFRLKGPKNAFYLNTVQFFTDKISNLSEKSEIKLSVYPNPSKDVFYLSNKDVHSVINYTVFDLNGQIKEKGSFKEKNSFGGNLPKGFYVVSFENEDKVYQYKLTKN